MNGASFLNNLLINLPLFRIKILAVFTLSFSISLNTFSQESKITLEKKNVKLEIVFNEIERITPYLFTYTNDLDIQKLISIKVSNASIEEVLHVIFKDLNVDFKILGKHIILASRASQVHMSTSKTSKLIYGKVIKVDGSPIEGATISSNNNTQTRTNNLGEFKIEASPSAVLTFRSLGFESKSITVNNASYYAIKLNEVVSLLDELAITGTL